MGFSGPGPGRPVGSKNKRTSLLDICDEVGLNVFKEMVTLANKTIDPLERFNKLRDIAPYLYARKKEMSVTLEDYSDEEFDQEVERRLNERRAPARISER